MNDYTFYEELEALIKKYQNSNHNFLWIPKDIKAHKLASFILSSLKTLVEINK